jgi:maltose alpha-D-glucosyltransferase/alpha-amylase
MIRLRAEHPVFGRGVLRLIKPQNRKIFSFIRSNFEETILCVFNLSQFAQPVELALNEYEGLVPVEMVGQTEFPPISSRFYQLALAPLGFYWFLLQKRTSETTTT